MNLNPQDYNKDNPVNKQGKEPDDSLQSKINDIEADRGIPQDLSTRTKNNLGLVVFLIIALAAVIFIIIGIMSFLKFEKQKKVIEPVVEVENVQNKNFDDEKNNLLDSLPPPLDSSTTTNDTLGNIPSEPTFTPHDRKQTGNVLVFSGSNSNERLTATTQKESYSTAIESASPNRLADNLNSTYFAATSAQQRINQTFLMNKGTIISCVLITKINTTYPGITKCQVTKDVYSADGKVLLLERGTIMIGEQQSALVQGQARVFVLWTQAETPEGIIVNLDSPGTGTLGASGHPAKVNRHFWLRFGNAILLSSINMLSDSLGSRLSKPSKNESLTIQSSPNTAQDLATEALKDGINIPPTGYVNQGTLLNIMVVRDVDFSRVYETIHRYEAYL